MLGDDKKILLMLDKPHKVNARKSTFQTKVLAFKTLYS